MERDERWEKVRAYIGPKKEFRGDEFDQGVNLEDWYEITLELYYEHMYYWRFEIMHMDDWKDLINEEGVLDFILTEMIASIDERLDEQSKRGALCRAFGSCVLDGDCPMFENCYLIGKENSESRAQAAPEEGCGGSR